jgi:hypothetical protein
MAHSTLKDGAMGLTVLTVAVDKKRLTPSLYRQIAAEDVIDGDTGELRGTPVGYFNIHPKEGCPQTPHKHVLWGTGTRLRLAAVVQRQDDPRYWQQEQSYQQRAGDLLDLLALLLARANNAYVLEERKQTTSKLVIAGYTLYVSSPAADLLKVLDHAQQQISTDRDLLLAQVPQGTEGQVGASDPLVDQLGGAETALRQLSELGIEVAHPVLYRSEHEGSSKWSTMRMLLGWHAYPSERSDERNAAVLYWKTDDLHARMEREQLAPTIEPHLASHGQAIRVILAERMLQKKRQEIQELAVQLVRKTSAVSAVASGAKKETTGQAARPLAMDDIDPTEVWELYEQEKTGFTN